MATRKAQVRMTGDHLLKNLLLFAYPLMISALCQRMFHMADSIVIGRFSGSTALAAVGSAGPVVELFTWGLMGLAVGADVVVSRLLGAGDRENVKTAVHTAYTIGLIGGFITWFLGFFFSRPLFIFTGVPEEVLPWSVLYIRIYFFGLFFTVLYNFGAAILRSSGDTTRPMKYLMFTGLLNVILNLIFVLFLHMDVAGVALATSISNFLAAALVTRALILEKGALHLDLRRLSLNPAYAIQIITIGLPSLVQNALFSVSNIMVQSKINDFGETTMAANSIAMTLENFVYISSGSFNQSCVTFTGQNVGAKNYKNIPKVLILAAMLTSGIGFSIGFGSYLFGRPLLGLFTKDSAVIEIGMIRLQIVAILLFFNAIVDVLAASLRGMGYSLVPTITCLTGICGFRALFIYTWFPKHPSLEVLYQCYPLSWILTMIALLIMWLIIYPRFKKRAS